MLNNHFYCVIMAGGIGSRFWPISRASRPKQFLDFTSDHRTFLRFTFDRMKAILPEENIIVVTLERYKEQVLQLLPELKEENLFMEPYNRNTAPCIYFATRVLLKRDPLAVVVVTPSDLVINNHVAFNETLHNALAYAAGTDALIALGVVPTRPDSNFGYIQMAGPAESGRPVKIKTFTEKPDIELARVFIDSGEFLWNSGIYVWRASEIREEFERYAPEIVNLWKGCDEMLESANFTSYLARVYADMPRISIDYAVMEKTDNAWVYPTTFRWADIGNWDSLYDYLAKHDKDGNAININEKSIVEECSRNIVYSDNPNKLFALRGLEDFIIIDTEDVLMICPRDSEKLKSFIAQIAMPGFEEYR